MEKTDIKIKNQKSSVRQAQDKKVKTTTPARLASESVAGRQKSKVEKKVVLRKNNDQIVKKTHPEPIKQANKKLAKVITGTVVSTKMEKTVVVSYTRKVAHKKYGKLMKVTKKIKADTNGMEINLGDLVKIQQTKPISKGKFFKVIATTTAKALGAKKEEVGK